MKKILIAFAILIVSGLFILKSITFNADIKGFFRTAPLSADKLFNLVNEWRIKNGYASYTKSESLCELANERLPEVRVNWNHDGFFARTTQNSNLPKGDYGENLAKFTRTEEFTLAAWIQSPEHYKNLTKPFTYSCIETDGKYVVEEFASY